jgi:cytochrome P450
MSHSALGREWFCCAPAIPDDLSGDLVPNDLYGPAAAGHDLADPSFWTLPERERLDAFARLRALPGPARFAGFSALVTHADVVAASRLPQLFLSGSGVSTPQSARWVRTVYGDSMLDTDDPRHAVLRGTVARAFTPELLARIEDNMREVAASVVDDVEKRRPEDFVSAVATPMAHRVICRMIGVPAAEEARMLAVLDGLAGDAAQRRPQPGGRLRAQAALHRMVARICRDRRREPADDLISALVSADADGEALSDRDVGAFVALLLGIGVGTTRDAIAHGLALLSEHHEQRSLLLADPDARIAGTIEEIVRHSSPIVRFRRTLAREQLVGDRLLPPGDTVVLYYVSANRDESVFDEPDLFDVTRSPNPHVGFGGGGPHFCLGDQLARREMDLLFRELYGRLPGLRATGPPELVPASVDNRVRRLPFTFDPI